jgi:intein-encoded DNA endonuclease-like protein
MANHQTENPEQLKKVNLQLPIPLIRRWEEAKWKERLSKREIAQRALEQYLDRLGV